MKHTSLSVIAPLSSSQRAAAIRNGWLTAPAPSPFRETASTPAKKSTKRKSKSA